MNHQDPRAATRPRGSGGAALRIAEIFERGLPELTDQYEAALARGETADTLVGVINESRGFPADPPELRFSIFQRAEFVGYLLDAEPTERLIRGKLLGWERPGWVPIVVRVDDLFWVVALRIPPAVGTRRS